MLAGFYSTCCAKKIYFPEYYNVIFSYFFFYLVQMSSSIYSERITKVAINETLITRLITKSVNKKKVILRFLSLAKCSKCTFSSTRTITKIWNCIATLLNSVAIYLIYNIRHDLIECLIRFVTFCCPMQRNMSEPKATPWLEAFVILLWNCPLQLLLYIYFKIHHRKWNMGAIFSWCIHNNNRGSAGQTYNSHGISRQKSAIFFWKQVCMLENPSWFKHNEEEINKSNILRWAC